MVKRDAPEIVEEEDVRVTVRVPAALSRRIDAEVARLQAKRRGAKVKRSEAVRGVLERGLPPET